MAAHSVPRSDPAENFFLAGLPHAVYQRLVGMADLVRSRSGDMLHRAGESPTYVYFPRGALFGLVATMENGAIAQVSAVGLEGMLGLELVLGERALPIAALCQLSGESLRLPAEAFVAEARADAALHGRLHRYAHARLVEFARQSACGLLHRADQRLARWLLHAHDRTGLDHLPLTQDFLANMLGVRRATITLAAGRLQSAGAARFTRGTADILDRTALASQACEDYQVINEEYQLLLSIAESVPSA
jgi:CRP-like cAMP-binding protein